MAAIDIKAFSGIRPLADPLLLETQEAVVAQNVTLLSGSLAPLLGTTVLKSLTKTAPKTIWRFGSSDVETEHWLEFAADVDVIASPLPTDIWGRAYWTDGTKPKYGPSTAILSGSSYPGASYDLGVPAPSVTPAISGSTPTVATNAESRTIVITYVTAYGEEGPPSPASPVVSLDPSAAATYSNLGSAPSGSYNIDKKRIYRSSTVGSSASFQFVAEIPASQTTYVDEIAQADLGEVLLTELWVAPPDNLAGLRLMANGAAIGFVGNTAYLSEPNLPHAWPHKYPIDYQIVGIGVFRQTAVLLTNGFPFALAGADPAAMSPERLELKQACVSKGSIVETGDGVLYASPDGLVSVGSAGISIITERHFSRRQWQALNPSSFRSYLHDNRYIAFYKLTDNSRGVLIIDPTGRGAFAATSTLNTATEVTAAYSDARTDTLYLAQGTNIVRHDQGSPLTYSWRSRPFRLAAPAAMSSAAIQAASYPVTLKVYADGALKQTRTVNSDSIFRLKSGFLATEWQFEISGSSEVRRLRVATSTTEIKSLP